MKLNLLCGGIISKIYVIYKKKFKIVFLRGRVDWLGF